MNFFKRFFGHLHTVNKHRRTVRKLCFKLGLYRQGLTHDLSKYLPAEFFGMYRDKNILEKNYDVDIQSVGEKCFLMFNQPIEFKTFAFLVNYLSFLESRE